MTFFSAQSLVLLVVSSVAAASAAGGRGVLGRRREGALLQTWGQALDGSGSATGAKDTPVTRVVNLLKEMSATLQKEMDEDAALYDKLACWCNNNEYSKTEAIEAGEAKVAELTSNIEGLTAKSSELKTTIKQLEDDVASNKDALAKATALREKEASEAHGGELDSVQAIENLKAALTVLGKHHGGALPQLSISLLSVRGQGRRGRDGPWASDHESALARSFDEFLDRNGFRTDDASAVSASQRFLQEPRVASPRTSASVWSAADTATVQRALKSASAFMQARQGEQYYPSYSARSGEIVGILKELKEQMEGDLSEAQKLESERQASFLELRASKTAEIEAGEAQAEQKEDELAKTSMDLAEAKEDLGQTQAVLDEDKKFVANLKATCEDGDKNFEMRKSARLSEIKAVADTINILTADEARDTMSRTYNFLQVSSSRTRREADRRSHAAKLLRRVAAEAENPSDLSILATRVELDSFSRVKKAIDDMIAMLKTQQADEVKKNSWCGEEIHSNEVLTTKTEDHKADLAAKADDLGAKATRLGEEVDAAKAQIAQLQLDLQRASENRQKESLDFQGTVADQRVTQKVLKAALERLAKYYDEEDLLQTSSRAKQTPPVPQMEYKPSAGSSGVMQLIEKLIYDARELEADSRKGEIAAQAQYESLVADTNGSVRALEREVTEKTAAKAQAGKEKTETEGDLADTVKELENLGKYNADLHAECDYLLKNFGARQEARGQEIEALQQAKQILSGAALS
mmetsp:Transcript_68149/g.145868  ORF Transcript_68149/g.145868 Transcript_68149/m.145868 type:complete len:753 (+) Transcript_68149:87-2345(+)